MRMGQTASLIITRTVALSMSPSHQRRSDVTAKFVFKRKTVAQPQTLAGCLKASNFPHLTCLIRLYFLATAWTRPFSVSDFLSADV